MRTGDTVFHRPSGETWILAWADPETDDVQPCGWPLSLARMSDCDLVRAATDAESDSLRAEMGGAMQRRADLLASRRKNDMAERGEITFAEWVKP